MCCCLGCIFCEIVTELFCFFAELFTDLTVPHLWKVVWQSLSHSLCLWVGWRNFLFLCCLLREGHRLCSYSTYTYILYVCVCKCLWLCVCLVLSVSSRKIQKDRMFCVPRSDTLIIKRKMYLAIMFCQAVSGPHALSFNILWGENTVTLVTFRGFKRVGCLVNKAWVCWSVEYRFKV